MKTNTGFEIVYFDDDCGCNYSLQESSSVDPHIWLGIGRIKEERDE